MEQTVIREDIYRALREYDKKKKTNFAMSLANKVTDAKLTNGVGDKAYGAYKRGEVHGLCLALVGLGVITNYDAQDILYELQG